MVFSSIIFLFSFFPLILVLYYGVGNLLQKHIKSRTFILSYKNYVLLLGSLFFYAYGEPVYVFLIIGSILLNWFFGPRISNFQNQAKTTGSKLSPDKIIVFLSVLSNFGVLFFFKYLTFFLDCVNRILHTELAVKSLPFPIGISFFTFQAISYVIDIYRKKAVAQKNPLKVGLYISFFPQLIAGPIVRYETIANQIDGRIETFDDFSKGCERFMTGVIKKILLADSLALFADRIFNSFSATTPISASMAWFGAICYTLQIYFDFSGYSDMAIGLGQMFGFHFEENFNYPYIARSVTDFWHRWHISLSIWFRDYVYIPLGGNRVPAPRMYLNLFIVWLLTGIWHGAGLTFILWGLMYFIVQTIEKLIGLGKKWKMPPVIGNLYTMLIVIVGWVLFRSPSIKSAILYLKNMFILSAESISDPAPLFYFKDNWLLFLSAFLFVTPFIKIIQKNKMIYYILLSLTFLIALLYLLKGSYSPFIYFSF